MGTLLLLTGLRGQCPNRDSLWRQINMLKDSAEMPALEARGKLLQIESRIRQCSYWQDSTRVLLLRAIGNTYFKQENYLEAIKYLQQSIAFIKRIPNNPAINERELVRVYYWMAVAFQRINNVTARIRSLDSCISIGNRLGQVDLSYLAAIYEKAEYSYDLGDYYHCSEYSNDCERIAFKYIPYADSVSRPAFVSYALSSFVWRVNSHIRLKHYDVAEALLNNQAKQKGVNSLYAYRGTFYGIRAEMEVHKGNYEQAIKSFRLALAVEKDP
ncbi:hypothetical protein [Paraflavitalea speifideaquila]|uniref:hypothetical protein n=1 Tax=Paraflavitalea speifideaquila TaxID=3076558 RepID=UPI0028EEA773|nr:hypothetical protein [Paraflavitalea speifideiaquila]